MNKCRSPLSRRALKMGSVYRPKLKNGQLQSTYRISYSVNGKKIIESTGLTSEAEAKRVLKEREGRVATGQPILPRVDKVKYDEVRDDLCQYYSTTGGSRTSRGRQAAQPPRHVLWRGPGGRHRPRHDPAVHRGASGAGRSQRHGEPRGDAPRHDAAPRCGGEQARALA